MDDEDDILNLQNGGSNVKDEENPWTRHTANLEYQATDPGIRADEMSLRSEVFHQVRREDGSSPRTSSSHQLKRSGGLTITNEDERRKRVKRSELEDFSRPISIKDEFKHHTVDEEQARKALTDAKEKFTPPAGDVDFLKWAAEEIKGRNARDASRLVLFSKTLSIMSGRKANLMAAVQLLRNYAHELFEELSAAEKVRDGLKQRGPRMASYHKQAEQLAMELRNHYSIFFDRVETLSKTADKA
ncbi:hypothetical protein FB567DRAFT_624191 [Paraphoma chrysanthemicola]|uniref:Uncharacterized protein n=1 Tax=Paraphoma chrysanthemicola TaxID=798071 RepID=A0A8K0RLJ3_9PLEO|nr:hypothetical protein FB567DRAFT_624191 [Paraphoma chrysanthemicola]